jgi:hypothetical protein
VRHSPSQNLAATTVPLLLSASVLGQSKIKPVFKSVYTQLQAQLSQQLFIKRGACLLCESYAYYV